MPDTAKKLNTSAFLPTGVATVANIPNSAGIYPSYGGGIWNTSGGN